VGFYSPSDANARQSVFNQAELRMCNSVADGGSKNMIADG